LSKTQKEDPEMVKRFAKNLFMVAIFSTLGAFTSQYLFEGNFNILSNPTGTLVIWTIAWIGVSVFITLTGKSDQSCCGPKKS
jgi:hypothetical protein